MRYLVIGGTRYMGRVVVERLLDRGDHVTVYSRGNNRPYWWDRVEHLIGDRTDAADLRSKLRGKDFGQPTGWQLGSNLVRDFRGLKLCQIHL